MLTDCIDISTQSKEQQNQASNYPYFVYNFPPAPLMEFQNTSIPQLQMRNSTDSVYKDNIQIPQFLQGLSVPSFQFNNSNQFCVNEQKVYIPPVENSLASYFHDQSIQKLKQHHKLNRIIVGTQTLCDIEIILVQRYFDIKTQLFCPPNIRYNLNEDKAITNMAWLKDRIKNRYKKPIKDSMFDLINVLGNMNEQEIRQINCFQKFSSQGFDNLEKQVPKSIKEEKPFSEMMFEIQILIAQFLLTKF
ncbi:unnamed protein product [Paramecium pentaurelia]|uniref:Uncharacterized protein n=1 Tax=Paramecium pentaurelia TaxID=43138 RepID=A0A8S1SRJ1_9CILI|nr:unnamed protein product [Paramecium pentaurelia]